MQWDLTIYKSDNMDEAEYFAKYLSWTVKVEEYPEIHMFKN